MRILQLRDIYAVETKEMYFKSTHWSRIVGISEGWTTCQQNRQAKDKFDGSYWCLSATISSYALSVLPLIMLKIDQENSPFYGMHKVKWMVEQNSISD